MIIKLKRELRYTFRFFEHMKSIVQAHFLISENFQSTLDYQDEAVYKSYIRDIFTNVPSYSDLTIEQQYLHSLAALTDPIISAYRTKNRIMRLQPRTRVINASFALEDSGRRLSMEAYHFKERVRIFAESSITLVNNKASVAGFNDKVSRILRSYNQQNSRLIRFRNFVVHGPRGRIDEFADLRHLQLACTFLHDDLWFEYKNEFNSTKSEWVVFEKKFIRSMEIAIASIQTLNENMILSIYSVVKRKNIPATSQ
jgi:hypothetical protein